jgi:membrane associated rhomboid family serine protease
MTNLAPTVQILIILNVIAFILSSLYPEYAIHFALWDIQSPYEEKFQPYQLLTYMFMHAGFFHIFSNMLGLVFFGSILEQVLGQNRFLLLYLVCGLGAGLLSLLVDDYRGDITPMVGASGAVYGVVTSFALIFPNMPLQMLFPPISLKAKYMVLLYLVFEVAYSVQNIPGDRVAHGVHLAGMLFGFIMIKLIWRISKKY